MFLAFTGWVPYLSMYPTPRPLHSVVGTYWSVRKPNAALLEVFTGHEPASVNGYVARARLFVCISLANEKVTF